MRAIYLAIAALLVAGCGSQPVGFDLRVRFSEIDPAVIEMLTIHFEPSDGTFMNGPPTSFEDGAINVAPQADGTLLMTVTGAYVNTNTMRATGSVGGTLELHIWSDDMGNNAGPNMFGSVNRAGELIGMGSAYLPNWPPMAGASSQLAIQCTPAAATAGHCM